ncbi:MAG: Holliday junction resolvase RuvX [Myxococcales bacterium]|nr:Holliday junction resolvase RuvX [Myxococcales bacterium]
MTVLAIDYGSSRVGLAISDEGEGIAMPLGTVQRAAGDVVAAVREALGERVVARVLVGLPLRLDGSEGDGARRARAFGEKLGATLGVPVEYVDERFSTHHATQRLDEVGVAGKDRRTMVDQAAATVLLQGYLDSRNESPWSEEDMDKITSAEVAGAQRRRKKRR